MGSASFGVLGALMERLGPIDGFDAEAFQHGPRSAERDGAL
jgi:hypothetical protein